VTVSDSTDTEGTGSTDFDGSLGLADFLSALRAELDEGVKRAEGQPLKLEIDEVTLSLDVAFTKAKKGEAEVGAKAKFWVFASADAKVKGELSSQRVDTQHLTLKLKPRIEEAWVDQSGTVHVLRRSVDVSGEVEVGEENPAG
jgi:Trypsin-co-occurring domain 2